MQLIRDIVDFESYLVQRTAQLIRPASDWVTEVKERLDGTGTVSGDLLPWSKTHQEVQLRPGEVSIWGGINGHGKSLVLGQVMLWLLPTRKVLIASMEMKPAATLERMLRQATSSHHPAKSFVDRFLSWTDDRLWIYDQQDSVAAEKILGMVSYAANELRMEHIVIDSLMKCGIAPDDYSGQKRFVDRLCWLAKSYNLHIHLVAHMRKGEREGQTPGKFDLKGASEISDLADNVFVVHRNKDKEERLRKGQEVPVGVPDAQLVVAKQRHGEWEGVVGLWFDKASNQFIPYRDAGGMPWPNPEERCSVFAVD